MLERDKTKKEKVGIVLVNYNGKIYNENCIESIKKSTHENYNIYVVDNDSKDNSVALLQEKFKDELTIIRNCENLGFSVANNIAIKRALEEECSYILLINNDTIVEESMIQKMLETALINSESIVCPKIYYYDDKKIIWSAGGTINWYKGLPVQYGIDEKEENQYSTTKKIEFATGCCILIPKIVIDKVGMLSDEYFLYYEDTDYSVKVINGGFDIMYSPEAKMYHKVSATTGGNKSRLSIYYMTRNRLIFNKKYNKKYLASNIYFYLTFSVKSIFWCINGEKYIFDTMKLAIKDFYDDKVGRVDYF